MSIATVAVIGAGIMGRGIAYVAALGGHATLLQDTNREQLESATAEVGAMPTKSAAAAIASALYTGQPYYAPAA